MLCDYQPHPLKFVWAYLLAGVIRWCSSQHTAVGWTRLFRILSSCALADLVSYCVFVVAASHSLVSIDGVVASWLICFAVSHPFRIVIARCFRREATPSQPSVSLVSTMSTLAAAAASSSAIIVLAMMLLKVELQERGDALDAALYSWHVATFYLSFAFGPACSSSMYSLGSPVSKRGDVTSPNDEDLNGIEGGLHSAHSKRSKHLRDAHDVPLTVMMNPDAAAAAAAVSLVGIGAFGVLPRNGVTWHARQASRRAIFSSTYSSALTLVVLACMGLASYVVAIRLLRAPPAELGFLVEECMHGDGTWPAKGDTFVSFGHHFTLLGFMYGQRRIAIPQRCAAPRTATPDRLRDKRPGGRNGSDISIAESRSDEIARAGLVLAADGSNAKYCEAVYVALHNIRYLQHSVLPAEIFHVGDAERFTPVAAAQLTRLGAISLLDMLPRLHPDIRQLAARRLRSFAAKPFALLASSFEVQSARGKPREDSCREPWGQPCGKPH